MNTKKLLILNNKAIVLTKNTKFILRDFRNVFNIIG